jgi:hypothetical protein
VSELEQRYTSYNTLITSDVDIETMSELTQEYYNTHFPPIPYLVFIEERSIVNEVYGTSKKTERSYDTYRIPINALVTPEEMGLTAFSIDVTRDSVFHSSKGLFEKLKIVPKIGDVIFFDNDYFDLKVVRRLERSKVAQTNAYLEYEFIGTVDQRDWA